MTFARYAVGVTSLAVIVCSLAWGSRRVRARIVPEWAGALALLADVVVVWTALIGTSQLLGVVGLFRLVPLLVACVALGVGGGLIAGSGRPSHAPDDEPAHRSRGEVALVAASVAIAVGTWVMATVRVLPLGIKASDSLQYHLPRAARFVQEGWLTQLHFTAPEFPDAFHPSNNEVVGAIGMMLFRHDVLSVPLNLVWLVCLLLAGWCVGTATRTQPLTLAAAAFVAAVPGFARDQPGTAANDVAAIFFVVAAAAFLAQVPLRRGAIVLASLSAGLALGTKLTVLAVVGALTIGVIVVAVRELGSRVITAWTVPLVVIGALWYVRNLVTAGSPVPGMRLGVGPLSFPYGGFALVDELGYRVIDYVTDLDIWTSWFAPALSGFFGPLWGAVLTVVAGAMVFALIVPRPAAQRMLAAVAIFGCIAYAFAPTSALGPPGSPFLFEGNLVYVMPAFALAAVLTPLVLRPATVRARVLLLAVAFVVLVVAQFSERSPWRRGPAAAGLVAIVVILLAFGGWLALRRSNVRAAPAVAVAAVCLFLGGWLLARWYGEHRYSDDPLARWAESVSGSRIAVAGLPDHYRLYDSALANHVELVGDRGPHGAIHPTDGCRQWRTALRDGRFDHVVLRPGDFSTHSPADQIEVEIGMSAVGERELRWTRSDPGAEEVTRLGRNIIFSFDARVPDPGC